MLPKSFSQLRHFSQVFLSSPKSLRDAVGVVNGSIEMLVNARQIRFLKSLEVVRIQSDPLEILYECVIEPESEKQLGLFVTQDVVPYAILHGKRPNVRIKHSLDLTSYENDSLQTSSLRVPGTQSGVPIRQHEVSNDRNQVSSFSATPTRSTLNFHKRAEQRQLKGKDNSRVQ